MPGYGGQNKRRINDDIPDLKHGENIISVLESENIFRLAFDCQFSAQNGRFRTENAA
jgi:hypothetical protein